MDTYFDIEIEVEGAHYSARVFPRYQELEIYFELLLVSVAGGIKQESVFIEMNNSGEWVQKIGMMEGIPLPNNFLEMAGREIENNQV